MKKNQKLADFLAEVVRALPKECFRNSALAIMTFHEDDSSVLYVEGMIALFGKPILLEHSWLEVNGDLVDVTLNDVEVKDYHAVFRYTQQQVLAHAQRKHHIFPIYVRQRDDCQTMAEAHHALLFKMLGPVSESFERLMQEGK